MFDEFKNMEMCFAREVLTENEWEEIIAKAAVSDSFFVRYGAAVAISRYGNEKQLGLLTELLNREEKEPIYGQKANLKNTDADAGDNMVGNIGFPAHTSEKEKQAWQRRGKIKQAVCLAAAEICKRHGPLAEGERLLDLLHIYILKQSEDYGVRAAAARALRAAGDEKSLDVLYKAQNDPEWCTKTEAKKSIRAIKERKEKKFGNFGDFVYNKNVNKTPFYIDDVNNLRNKVLNAEDEFIKNLWNGIKNRARGFNGAYPWFEPFTALITGEKSDFERACEGIRSYVKSLENLRYNPGVHFHSWCFALPHARWTLYLQWLYALGAFSESEAKELMQKLVAHQFMYYYSCYRVKPCPETVDNQTLSLAISNALIGYIAGNPPFDSRIARHMFCESIERIELILKKMGEESYSGEGSTYMNHVIASCIPLGTELLERIYKKEYFSKCRSVSEMMAKEVMPDGLALPWDHYGYILPTLQCLSYNSRRISAKKYTDMLKEYTDYSFSVVTGWGFDDLVWTLIWYNENGGNDGKKVFESWYTEKIAACVVSEDMQLAAVQMLDDGKSEHIARFHCNPNALILSAYGSPLLTEGVPENECDRFKFKDTEKTFGFMSIEAQTVNDGYGCAGAHSVILVDNYEAMRPADESAQLGQAEFGGNSIYADVTPIYRQNFADARLAARKTTLMYNRFWLTEDKVRFENEHDFSMRLITRPQAEKIGDWICVTTPEYVRLYITELDGGGETSMENVDGYPNTLEKKSVITDNKKYGRTAHWHHLMIPYDCKREIEDITNDWTSIADPGKEYDVNEVLSKIGSGIKVPIKAPVYFFKEASCSGRWWYYKKIKTPMRNFLLRLPRNLHNAGIWINNVKYDTRDTGLMPMYVHVKNAETAETEILIRTDIGTAQYKDKYSGGGFFGKAAVYEFTDVPCPEIIRNGKKLILKDGNNTYTIAEE